MMNSTAVFLSASLAVILSTFFLRNNTDNNQQANINNNNVGGAAELIVRNGLIYTSDPSLPFADSMAIRNGRLLRLGNFSDLQELQGETTKTLDLEGKVVVPGFIDSHVHLLLGGMQMAQVELHGVNSKDKFVKKIQEAVQGAKEGSWIFGGGWNNDLWGGEQPTAGWIDHITPHNPVWLLRMDGHKCLANSVALKLAGITRDTKDPIGGSIVKTVDGEPTGLLVDAAAELVLPSIPETSIDERREALLRASDYALRKGVTTVVDMGRRLPGYSVDLPWEDFTDVYSWADSSGQMRIRVCLFFPLETWSRLVDLVQKTGKVISEWLYLGGVKAFYDGSLGSNSALMYEPYADDPTSYGLQVKDLESLTNLTTLSEKYGLQVAIHAIGDRANDLLLDMYESVASADRTRDRRFRIEHAQHLAPGAAARFGKQGVIASVQPEHLLDDADAAYKKLGKERAETQSYLFHSLRASHATLAFGSDWPVADIDPLNTLRAAVKRIPLGWDTPFIPSECLSLDEALEAHTISAAYGSFLDKDVGSLSPGKLADFVILSVDSWETFLEEAYASVEATYVGGVKAYSAKDVNISVM